MARIINLPAPICQQGAHSSTFTSPPHDTYLSVPEVYDWHWEHSSSHPFFVYHDDNKATTVYWKDAAQAVYRIAKALAVELGTRNDAPKKPLVGLYSSSDTLTYILSLVGILRAGFPVFLISNRTSPAALEHLLTKSNVSHILMNEGDMQLVTRLEDAKRSLSSDITASYIPSWDQLFSPEFEVEKLPTVQPNLEDLCLILHSSGVFKLSYVCANKGITERASWTGSTALPDLNLWTHGMVHTSLWQPWYGEKDMCGQVLSTPSVPMAGASGVMQALFTASSGLVLSGFKPTSPPTQPTPSNVWKNMLETGSTYSFILQPFLASWFEDPTKAPVLAQLEGVVFGGAPLSKVVGDELAKKGVTLFPFYGSSEGGLLNMVFPRPLGMDWEYFRFYSLVSPGFRKDSDDGTVELIIKSSPTHVPTKINTTFESVPAYTTGDLLQPHPTVPGLWKFFCRAEDQQIIAPGWKVNAVALARILMADPNIAGAVVVGILVKSSFAFGAIIEASQNTPVSDAESYKDLIWPTIEHYNTIAPDPARLTRQRIILASKSKPFTYGEKGMPRRKEALANYNEDIIKLV